MRFAEHENIPASLTMYNIRPFCFVLVYQNPFNSVAREATVGDQASALHEAAHR